MIFARLRSFDQSRHHVVWDYCIVRQLGIKEHPCEQIARGYVNNNIGPWTPWHPGYERTNEEDARGARGMGLVLKKLPLDLRGPKINPYTGL
jgi:hypothetical protein